MNQTTKNYIRTAHPLVWEMLTNIALKIDQVLTGRSQFVLTFSFRTDAEQDALYALGRTKVNPDGKSASRPFGYKVTNARGGESIHNYGLAVDFCLLIDGKKYSWDDGADFDNDKIADWMEVVTIFKAAGWQWGGDWSSIIDKPHFQYTFGLTLKQLQAKRAAKDFTPGTKWVRIPLTKGKEFKVLTGLNLRPEASTDNQPILTIPAGTKVIEIERKGEWSKVDFGPKEGWVSNKYLAA